MIKTFRAQNYGCLVDVNAALTPLHAFVFVRDQDGDLGRQAHLEAGIRMVREGEFAPTLVGGVAVQEIEAWVLALLGERKTEQHSDAKDVLVKKHAVTTCEGKVAVVENADRSKISDDAASLRAWLAQVDACFVAPP